MSQATKVRRERDVEPVRVLGRGLRAQRGVHLTMRTVREAVDKTQAAVAQAAQMDQSDVSRLESRETFGECQVSTLERYIAALGGQLELVAAFGDKKIILAGLGGKPANKANGADALKSSARLMRSVRPIRNIERRLGHETQGLSGDDDRELSCGVGEPRCCRRGTSADHARLVGAPRSVRAVRLSGRSRRGSAR